MIIFILEKPLWFMLSCVSAQKYKSSAILQHNFGGSLKHLVEANLKPHCYLVLTLVLKQILSDRGARNRGMFLFNITLMY